MFDPACPTTTELPLFTFVEHDGTTIVFAELFAGTITSERRSCTTELRAALSPFAGIFAPGPSANAAEGSRPPTLGGQRGTTTTRSPEPCGTWTRVAPVVDSCWLALAAVTETPVAHGGTTTVRALSAVGTITARPPWPPVPPFFFGIAAAMPPTSTSSASITTQITRDWPTAVNAASGPGRARRSPRAPRRR